MSCAREHNHTMWHWACSVCPRSRSTRVPNIKVKGQTVQPTEHRQTNGQTDGRYHILSKGPLKKKLKYVLSEPRYFGQFWPKNNLHHAQPRWLMVDPFKLGTNQWWLGGGGSGTGFPFNFFSWGTARSNFFSNSSSDKRNGFVMKCRYKSIGHIFLGLVEAEIWPGKSVGLV